MDKKSFVTLAPEANVIKLFTKVIYRHSLVIPGNTVFQNYITLVNTVDWQ
jgi:hypothetical protein